ncbi:hypothetical protein EPD60_13305 [Flaviaesturariibacter flavus]|uniref:Uncharacterized protein n=1 Tax=Flaviaesturariibacter flavus TaxID=2502780 RepID=A0A4R1B6L7_9BACT|nr:pre-peptidase C-terminal domain-containing protein [Flaviaesturariibacter flavus]TCJ13360.1 hypothetical protein EPD60_13305 [Flaviaesturariibacter flavus]
MRALLSLLLLVFNCAVFGQTPPAWSSMPDVRPTIFLDFDGHTVTGTQWNTAGPVVCGPANITQAQIAEIYERIAEDYRPFAVNVTTDSTKYWAAPAKQRMRVIFTISNSWYSNGVGGVSYTNSFTWGDNTPNFVFTTLLQYNTKWLAEAGAHEVGHTLGLRHQASYNSSCGKITDYYAGTGSGEIGWAPIMGVGYYQNMTTWNLGPNSLGCNNMQSDVDVITRTLNGVPVNGIAYRTDDVPETMAEAANTTFDADTFRIQGVIERAADRDLFKFRLDRGARFRLDAVPFNLGSGNVGSDLDIQVLLLDATGTQLGSYNPAPLLNSVIDTALATGDYYLMIDGKGNQFAPEYGSLGSYDLKASATPFNVLPLYQLTLHGSSAGGRHTLNWKVVADEVLTEQVLEASDDGRNFYVLATPPPGTTSYTYTVAEGARRQYRIKVVFNNGRYYYSKAVLLAAAAGATPQLLRTVAQGGSLAVQSPVAGRYQVGNALGQVMAAGVLPQGSSNLPLPRLAAGAYWVRFTVGGSETVQKFIQP